MSKKISEIFTRTGKKNKQELINCRIMSDLLDPDGDAVESWRVFRIMAEFVEGFEFLRKYGLAASFFGGSRFNQNDSIYQESEQLATKLSEQGFAIITGGGPGVMEAANIGSFKVGGKSVGFNIKLPMEQKLNPYVTESKNFNFFFSRKVMLAFASEVYICFPGGFGTLDEFFEIVTLIQTRKISRIPVVLYKKDYWSPLIEFFKRDLIEKYKTISPEDLELFHLVDSVDEAYEYITETVKTNQVCQV